MSLLVGLLSRFPVVAIRVVSLVNDIEWVVSAEACHIQKLLLVFLCVLKVHLPRSPLLHDAEEFEFVVSSSNQLFDEAASDFLFDIADAVVLINLLHSPAGLLTSIVLVSVFFGQILDLSQDQVVKFHELHSWERLDIKEGLSGGKLQRS